MAGAKKKYFSVFNDGVQDLYVKDAEAREQIENIELSLPDFESDGAIDTMFDTEFDTATGQLKFGAGCASMDESTGVMTIEGAVVPVIENGVEVGKMIVIS